MTHTEGHPQHEAALLNLFSHGVLPFVHREEEIQRILRFVNMESFDGGLAVFELSGEAGVGKSRLLQEALSRIVDSGVSVVRVALHEESVQTLSALLADALWRHQPISQILRERPADSISSVVTALRRVSRLRPLLLILEDIHLLDGASSAMFAKLVLALSEESLLMLCSTRNLSCTGIEYVRPFVHERLALVGLSTEATAELCTALFGPEQSSRIGSSVPQKLQESTNGNPLALRMALRSCLAKESVVSTDSASIGALARPVVLSFNPALLDTAVRSSRKIIAEGLSAQLLHAEREIAEQLATLGEMFSLETATLYLQLNPDALSPLVEKGILVEMHTQSSVLGSNQSKQSCLCFSHSLLFQQLLSSKRFEAERFWSIIEHELPLYSLLPFELLSESAQSLKINPDRILHGIYLIGQMTKDLSRSFDADVYARLNTVFESLLASFSSLLSTEHHRELEVLKVMFLKIPQYTYRGCREGAARRDEYLGILSTLEAEVDKLKGERSLLLRLFVAKDLFCYHLSTYGVVDTQKLRVIDEILEQTTDFQTVKMFYYFLSKAAEFSLQLQYLSMYTKEYNSQDPRISKFLDWLDNHLERILLNGDERLAAYAATYIYPQMLDLFRSEQELQRSYRMMSLIDSLGQKNDIYSMRAISEFQMRVGDAEKAFRYFDGLYFQSQHSPDGFAGRDFDRILYMGVLNFELEQIVADAARYVKQSSRPDFANNSPYLIWTTLLLRGEVESTSLVQFDARYPVHRIYAVELIATAERKTLDRDFEALKELFEVHEKNSWFFSIESTRFNSQTILTLSRHIFGSEVLDEQSLFELLDSTLQRSNSDFSKYLDLLTLLSLLELAEQRGQRIVSERLYPSLQKAIRSCMQWLIDSKRIVCAQVFPLHFTRYFSTAELSEWRRVIQEQLHEQHARLRPVSVPLATGTHVSLISDISFTTATDSKTQIMKGHRLKTVLGLMALDAVLPKPLRRTEFLDIAAGEAIDIEAKRNILKVAVYQLRKLLGQNAIVQGKEKPELNLSLLRVDLIELWQEIYRAEEDLAANSLKSARNKVLSVLSRFRGEVLFPTLYDNIFESARDEFEVQLRSLALRVAHAHIREQDLESAENILLEAHQCIPGDDELASLLSTVLKERSKHIESTRTKRTLEYLV